MKEWGTHFNIGLEAGWRHSGDLVEIQRVNTKAR